MAAAGRQKPSLRTLHHYMPDFRSGFIAVIGRPNAGKSTLINALLGQKIAAVSPRPQTTRRRQLGILTRPEAQLVFVDTPGIHAARHKLGEYLNQEAQQALEGVDVVLWIADITAEPGEDDRRIAALLGGLPPRLPQVMAANKIDLVPAAGRAAAIESYRALLTAGAHVAPISALQSQGLDELVSLLETLLPERPPEFEQDQITDLYEREIAADLIREAALLKLRDEVPHGIAVRIDQYTERPNGVSYIEATLFVERDSQKGIVIGQGGRMLKQIGSQARQEIESMAGRQVYLQLRVKVEKDWRNNEAVLRRLGYKLKK